MVVEWGTVIAILVPVAGLVGGAFRVLDGRLTRIDRRAEERHKDLEHRVEERHKDLKYRAEERHKDLELRAEERYKALELRAEERHKDLVTLIRGYHPTVSAHDPGMGP